MNEEYEPLPDGIWEFRHDTEIRDYIILTHWPMLTRVVGRIRQTLPPHVRVDEEDLRMYGLIGMYKALERYDETLGHPFDKFASNFVRGAVLDELRAQDWAPRSLRKRQKDMEACARELTTKLGRVPSTSEIAESLGWTTHDVQHTRKQVDTSWPRSLDEIRYAADERDMYALVADAQGSVEQNAIGMHDSHENDRSTLLNESMVLCISKMPAQKKAIVVMRYYLDLDQRDVAALLGVPVAKVDQIHQGVMEDLHAELVTLLSSHIE